MPTLLYAQDTTSRVLNLGDLTNNNDAGLVTETNGAYQFDLNPDHVVLQTKSHLSWTPYQYADGSWQVPDIESYLTHLDSRLQAETYFQPADDTEAAIEEAELRRGWVQLYYASLLMGLDAITEMDNVPINARASNPNIPEASYAPILVPGADFGGVILALLFLDIVSNFSFQNAQTQLSFRAVGTMQFAAVYSLAVLTTWAGLAFILAGMITGDQSLIRTGQVILAVVNLVVVSAYAVNALYAISLGFRGIATAANQATNYQSLGTYGLAIGLTLIWGFFIFQVATQNMNEVEFNVSLSLTIAATIFYVLLFLTSIIGLGIIGILLSLVDSIFLLMGKKAPTQYFVEFLANTLYDIDLSITNLGSTDRLEIDLKNVEFVDLAKGFRANNSLTVTMAITNTVKYHRDLYEEEEKVAKRNVFTYTLQTEKNTFVTDLPYWDDAGSDQWRPLTGRILRTDSENNIVYALSTVGAGINQNLEVYYSEAFRSGYRACWRIPISAFYAPEVCEWKDFKDTIHYPLSETLVFDVFPLTISEFARMDWSDTEPPLPLQADLDADGIVNQGGTDPNDAYYTGFDSDGDGLSDSYEISNGYNALSPDADFDGLTDYQELTYGTNPFIADTDGDGLNDRIELVDGWLVVYEGNQLMRVWSDPFFADRDGDGLEDLEEFVFGFNPWVATDPSRILSLVQFDNLGVVESDAPELLLHFDDATNSTTFFDSSGTAHHGSCADLTNCPSIDVSGRYRQSLQFDAVDDMVTVNKVDFARADYTIVFWFQTDATTDQAILSAIGAESNAYGTLLQIQGSGEIRFLHRFPASNSGGTNIYSPGTYNDGQWHHLAAVHENGVIRLYLDGSEVITGSVTGQATEEMNLVLGRLGLANSRWFDGNLDDLAIFDEALSSSEIGDVMSGRFNPDDRVLTPDAELSYQAVVTNTSSTNATGFLVAENSYFAPELRQPVGAFNLDADQRLTFFANGTGDENSAVCVDNGDCPYFGLPGRYGDGLDFFQTRDHVLLPTLTADATFSQGNFNLSFWIRPDALPAAGQRAMLLDTESTETGAVDIYLNDSGKLVWDIVGDPYGQRVSNGNLSVGSWTHVALNGHYTLYLNQ